MAASGDQSQDSSKTNVDKEIDDELNELLDSALEDFGANANENKPGTAKESSKVPQAAGGEDSETDAVTEQFSDDLAREFEDAMKGFFSNDPNMLHQIEKMAEAAGTAEDTPESEKVFGDTLKEALSGLAQNTEGLQDTGGAAGFDDDVMKMFSGMGLEGGAQDDGFMPMMQNMMKTLLSKEVLYPSLKEISDKYPKWLTDNKDKITETQYSNYSRQKDIITDILAEFDKETASDTDDVKKQRFEQVMDLMQKMQDLGQPPKEIVGDMAPGLDFDANGVPKFPGSPDACSMM